MGWAACFCSQPHSIPTHLHKSKPALVSRTLQDMRPNQATPWRLCRVALVHEIVKGNDRSWLVRWTLVVCRDVSGEALISRRPARKVGAYRRCVSEFRNVYLHSPGRPASSTTDRGMMALVQKTDCRAPELSAQCQSSTKLIEPTAILRRAKARISGLCGGGGGSKTRDACRMPVCCQMSGSAPSEVGVQFFWWESKSRHEKP